MDIGKLTKQLFGTRIVQYEEQEGEKFIRTFLEEHDLETFFSDPPDRERLRKKTKRGLRIGILAYLQDHHHEGYGSIYALPTWKLRDCISWEYPVALGMIYFTGGIAAVLGRETTLPETEIVRYANAVAYHYVGFLRESIRLLRRRLEHQLQQKKEREYY